MSGVGGMLLLGVCALVRGAAGQSTAVAPPPNAPVASSPAASADGAPGAERTLEPGDILRIAVWRNAELSGEFTIGPDSALKHPLYQSVKVGGVTPSVARERLAAFLNEFEATPQFSVEPLYHIAVAGEVRNPNVYTVPGETTIAQAIALAGGATDRGRIDRVHLIRDTQDITIDLTKPGSEWATAPIRSGDRILIARRRDLLREMIAPLASVTAAVVSIIGILTR